MVYKGAIQLSAGLKKYGNFDVSNKSLDFMEKSKDREGFELQQKVRLLERKNAPFGEGT